MSSRALKIRWNPCAPLARRARTAHNTVQIPKAVRGLYVVLKAVLQWEQAIYTGSIQCDERRFSNGSEPSALSSGISRVLR